MIKNIFAAVILSLIVAVIAAIGFYLIGSPAEVRGVKFDTLRQQDIGKIKYAIEDYYRANKKMPISLNELLVKDSKNYTNKPYLGKELKDPKTGKVYDYKDLGAGKFQICAEFETSAEEIQERKTGINSLNSVLSLDSYSTENRLHPKGNYCYEYEIPGYALSSNTVANEAVQPSSGSLDTYFQGVNLVADPLVKGIPDAGYSIRVQTIVRNLGTVTSAPYTVTWSVDQGTSGCAPGSTSATCTFTDGQLTGFAFADSHFDFNPTASQYKVCLSINSLAPKCETFTTTTS